MVGGTFVLLEATVIAVGPSSIVSQLPWELTLGEHVLTVNRPGPVYSPFAANNQASLAAVNYDPAFLAVAHQDWTPITSSQPAQEGEILHFYMTGLGPVTPYIATGEITPVGPLFTAIAPDCRGFEASFEILFAGLAPGLAGIYQVDTKISGLNSPSPSANPYRANFACGNASSSFYAQASSN